MVTSVMPMLIAAILPMQEMQAVNEVAKEYSLTKEEKALLIAIRKTENGSCGIEYGVGQEVEGHPAKRFKGDAKRSFKLQAQWAAGTIKRRYKGDIDAFAKRWCPRNHKVWAKNTRFFVAKAMKEI